MPVLLVEIRMNHEDATLVLADEAQGRLDPGVTVELKAHLAGCNECQALSETYRLFSSALAAEASAVSGAHPSSEMIVAYATAAEELQTGALARIALHVRSCRECEKEVETIRLSEESARGRVSLFDAIRHGLLDLRPPTLAAAAAAGFMILLLGYPAFLGLVRLPGVTRRASALVLEKDRLASELTTRIDALKSEFDARIDELQRSAASSGPFEMYFLGGASRGGEPEGALKIRNDQPSLHIAVELNPRAISADDNRYRFEILNKGRLVQSWEMTGTTIRRYLDSPQGAVLLSIPSSDLPPEVYELKVKRSGSREGEPLFSKQFETIR